MSNESIGLVIGGVIPALLLGVFFVLQKMATRYGAGPGQYLFLLGLISAVLSGAVILFGKQVEFTIVGSMWTVASSACWGLAMAGMAYSLFKYHIPMSKLNPILNTNTLTAVILSIVFFG